MGVSYVFEICSFDSQEYAIQISGCNLLPGRDKADCYFLRLLNIKIIYNIFKFIIILRSLKIFIFVI